MKFKMPLTDNDPTIIIFYLLYSRGGQGNMVKSRSHSKIDAIIPEN
jgi:hypothetical protein